MNDCELRLKVSPHKQWDGKLDDRDVAECERRIEWVAYEYEMRRTEPFKARGLPFAWRDIKFVREEVYRTYDPQAPDNSEEILLRASRTVRDRAVGALDLKLLSAMAGWS